jgi:hypothetical protein
MLSKLGFAAHGGNIFLGQFGPADHVRAQVTFARAGLWAIQVSLTGLLAFEFAGCGNTKSLFGPFMGFHLWHLFTDQICEVHPSGYRLVSIYDPEGNCVLLSGMIEI